MKKLNLVVIGIVAALVQPCFAGNVGANAQQRLQTYQSMTPAQQQAAKLSAMQQAEGVAQQKQQVWSSMTTTQQQAAMATMRSNMQSTAAGLSIRDRK